MGTNQGRIQKVQEINVQPFAGELEKIKEWKSWKTKK